MFLASSNAVYQKVGATGSIAPENILHLRVAGLSNATLLNLGIYNRSPQRAVQDQQAYHHLGPVRNANSQVSPETC